MSLTITNVRKDDVGLGQRITDDVTFDASYSWGGELVTAQALGFRVGSRLDSVQATPVNGYLLEFVPHATLAGSGYLRVLRSNADDFMAARTRPGVAIGTVSLAEVKIANPITKAIAGAFAEVAAAEHAFTSPGHDITADAAKIQEAVYLLSTNAAGAVAIAKGVTADEDAAVPPALPAGQALIGYVRIQVAAGLVDFDATTDDLDASHLATTFYDADEEALEGTDLSGLTVRVVAEGR